MSDKSKRYLVAALYAVLMVLAADAAREKEIIFPEIIALLIGGLLSPKQVWICGGPMLVGLMTFSAVCGVCISAFLPLPLLGKLAVGFLLVALLLIVTRTTLAPIISACILPILLHTTSWIYPVSVLAAALVIAATRRAFEHWRMSAPSDLPEGKIRWREELPKWGKLFLVFLAVAAVPALTGNPYFIAPPLLVTFVESASFKPVMRKFTKKLIPFTLFAALLGVSARYVLADWLSLPLFVPALVITVLLFLVIEKTSLLFPPIGAISFLPLILPAQGLWLYPLEVTAGLCVFLAAVFLFFPIPKEPA